MSTQSRIAKKILNGNETETSLRSPPKNHSTKQINSVGAKEIDKGLESAKRLEMHQLGALLNLEEKIRKCKTQDELTILAANDMRNLAGARQVFVWHWNHKDQLTLAAVSSLETVDQTSPFVQWLTRVVQKFSEENSLTENTQFQSSEYSNESELELRTYPFPFFNWVPLVRGDGKSMGGVLLSKETEWGSANQARLMHMSRAFSHAFSRFTTRKLRRQSPPVTKVIASIIGALVGASMFYPVTLTTLAPVSVTPQDAFIVTSPIDGVVKSVQIGPNSDVLPGDLLVVLESENLLNDLEVSKREFEEAEARLKSITKTAFLDPTAKRELRVAAAQVKIKSAQMNRAETVWKRSRIAANRNGVAVFNTREEWVGKPVQTGELIMKIADPNKKEFTIEVPVADAIVLKENARVKYFMDSSPLDPIEGQVRHASFEATEQLGDRLAYTITADVVDADDLAKVRLGGQGTAQLYGDEVPLYLYLFRKPISAFRQFTGL